MTQKKIALVTGGTRGIGLATVERLLRHGFHVVVAARNTSGVPKRTEIKTVQCDLATIEGVESVKNAVEWVDVLINNAGMMYGVPYSKYSEDMRRTILQLNLDSPLNLSWHYGSKMAEKGGGRIVNNASIAGEIGHPDAWYGITKAGVINFTKSLARTFGARGVVINAVAAGPVETDMLAAIPPERQEAIKRSVISARFARPDEVAEVIVWLATHCPDYVNGICIDINNGAFPR